MDPQDEPVTEVDLIRPNEVNGILSLVPLNYRGEPDSTAFMWIDFDLERYKVNTTSLRGTFKQVSFVVPDNLPMFVDMPIMKRGEVMNEMFMARVPRIVSGAPFKLIPINPGYDGKMAERRRGLSISMDFDSPTSYLTSVILAEGITGSFPRNDSVLAFAEPGDGLPHIYAVRVIVTSNVDRHQENAAIEAHLIGDQVTETLVTRENLPTTAAEDTVTLYTEWARRGLI